MRRTVLIATPAFFARSVCSHPQALWLLSIADP